MNKGGTHPGTRRGPTPAGQVGPTGGPYIGTRCGPCPILEGCEGAGLKGRSESWRVHPLLLGFAEEGVGANHCHEVDHQPGDGSLDEPSVAGVRLAVRESSDCEQLGE